MRLNYLVKVKTRVFCESSNAGRAKRKKFHLLTLILLTGIEKNATFRL